MGIIILYSSKNANFSFIFPLKKGFYLAFFLLSWQRLASSSSSVLPLSVKFFFISLSIYLYNLSLASAKSTFLSTLNGLKKVTVKLLATSAVWYGVTYKDDKDYVVSSLKALVDAGQYKKGLWD